MRTISSRLDASVGLEATVLAGDDATWRSSGVGMGGVWGTIDEGEGG